LALLIAPGKVAGNRRLGPGAPPAGGSAALTAAVAAVLDD